MRSAACTCCTGSGTQAPPIYANLGKNFLQLSCSAHGAALTDGTAREYAMPQACREQWCVYVVRSIWPSNYDRSIGGGGGTIACMQRVHVSALHMCVLLWALYMVVADSQAYIHLIKR